MVNKNQKSPPLRGEISPQAEKIKNQKLRIRIGKIMLENPVIAASGTFGYGEEMKEFYDINKLGAVVTKTTTLKPRDGNPMPRVVETPSGMLNSIGLENEGLEDFILNKIPFLEKLKTNVIVSIAGNSIDEFKQLTEELSKLRCISAIELNLSCPNIVPACPAGRHRPSSIVHRLIAQDKLATRKVVQSARKRTRLTLITKLSPNVTDIREIAKAAEDAGTDAISLINTVFGMSVNIKTKRSNLGSRHGGLSGPAVKPIALNLVREAYQAVKIPIIGMGGIFTAEDALEFIICGSTAIQVGTANFVNPEVAIDVIDGIAGYMRRNKIRNINSLIGSLVASS